MDGAFAFKVLPSNNDSIRILFENHTNLEVQPVFFPSISTDERYMVHPFARSGWVGEANYMKSRARLKGGEAILFTIPVSWDVNRITDRKRQETIPSRQVTFRKIPNRTATRNLYGYGI